MKMSSIRERGECRKENDAGRKENESERMEQGTEKSTTKPTRERW
jgi:hypothetical protein